MDWTCGCIILVLLIAIGYFFTKKRENYGEMRRVVKIPFNDCAGICKQHYQDCLSRGDDGGWCETRFGDQGCVAECYYSNYHRLPG